MSARLDRTTYPHSLTTAMGAISSLLMSAHVFAPSPEKSTCNAGQRGRQEYERGRLWNDTLRDYNLPGRSGVIESDGSKIGVVRGGARADKVDQGSTG